MRTRPHVLSTRLGDAERAAFVALLSSPSGGWFVPSAYARWALLRPDRPSLPAEAAKLDAERITLAVRPLRSFGRTVNWLAFAMNSTRRLPSAWAFSHLAARWPAVRTAVTSAIKAEALTHDSPVAVIAVPPSVVVGAQPRFSQRPTGPRQRQTVVAVRLSDKEWAAVQTAAVAAAVDPADFFRARLLEAAPLRRRKLSRTVARALAVVLEECGRQANNWRQLHRAHQPVGASPPPVVTEALADLKSCRDAVVPHLSRWRQ